MTKERIQKFLSRMGVASRRAAEDLVIDVEFVDDAGAAGILAASGVVLPF